ncbi:bacteriocin [Halorarum salinum]|uniref:Bacteriocin n=1 Tax=Halorarum salinum TaxID=2743089 RepID=A0A7D5LCZ9_9EURY|nr:bacteriocin [Halobaculum salinum]QLG63089.1 bacteriocin [Halobaculum salinum]
MSTANVQIPETFGPKEFENSLPLTAQAALYNPVPDVREQALAQLRADSVFDPGAWERLDEATGVKKTDQNERLQELVADSTLVVDSWEQISDMVLDDQFVGSTVVDQLMAAGFDVSSSLNRYAYFNPLSNVRLEAEVGMNLRTQGEQDMPAFGLDGVPLPLHTVEYQIDAREYQNAVAYGEDFDDSVGTEARRALNRSESEMLWSGWGGEVETERGLVSVAGLDQDITQILQASGSTGWIGDAVGVMEDIDELHDTIESQTDVVDEDDVPLVSEVGARVLVPRAMWGEVQRQNYQDANGATDEPLIDRISRKYPYLNLMPAPRLDADSVIMLLDDPRYFQIVNAQGVTNTTWESDGGAALNARLVSSRTPFVRQQPDGINGIVRMTGINQ